MFDQGQFIQNRPLWFDLVYEKKMMMIITIMIITIITTIIPSSKNLKKLWSQ